MSQEITDVELEFLTLDDYHELKEVMISSYHSDPNAFWKE